MRDLIEQVTGALEKVVVGDKKFSLVTVSLKRKELDDFLAMYGDELDDFRKNLAKSLFGAEAATNHYTLLIDSEGKVVQAFNNKFARYDPESKRVEYKTAEEVLLENTTGDITETIPARLLVPPHFFPGGEYVLKYALPELTRRREDWFPLPEDRFLLPRRPDMVIKYGLPGK